MAQLPAAISTLICWGFTPRGRTRQPFQTVARARSTERICCVPYRSLTEARIPEETKAGLPSRGREARKRDAEQGKGWRNGQANLNGICICASLSTSRLL